MDTLVVLLNTTTSFIPLPGTATLARMFILFNVSCVWAKYRYTLPKSRLFRSEIHVEVGLWLGGSLSMLVFTPVFGQTG